MAVVQALLAAKADVNAKDNEGNTALMVAVRSRSVEVVRLLKNAGAKATLGIVTHTAIPAAEKTAAPSPECWSSDRRYVVTFSADHLTAKLEGMLRPEYGPLRCKPAGDAGNLECKLGVRIMDGGVFLHVNEREKTGGISVGSIAGPQHLADLTCNF